LIEPNSITLWVGEQVQFFCQLNEPWWTLNRGPLPEDVFVADKVLSIAYAKIEHSGSYACEGYQGNAQDIMKYGVGELTVEGESFYI